MGRPAKGPRVRIGEKPAEAERKRVKSAARKAIDSGFGNVTARSVLGFDVAGRPKSGSGSLENAHNLANTHANQPKRQADVSLLAVKGMQDFLEALKKPRMFLHHALAIAGISRNTLNTWRANGALGIEPYAQFCRDMEIADSEQMGGCLDELFQLDCDPNEKAKNLRWYMERRWPIHLAERKYVMVQGIEHVDAILALVREHTDGQTFLKIINGIADLRGLSLGGRPGPGRVGGEGATPALLDAAGESVD